jgi:hypothetical protein
MHVYLAQHVHEFDDGHEDVKMLGVFSSEENAQAAIARVKDQPGFKDTPEGFHVTEYQVDTESVGWGEGFVTVP